MTDADYERMTDPIADDMGEVLETEEVPTNPVIRRLRALKRVCSQRLAGFDGANDTVL